MAQDKTKVTAEIEEIDADDDLDGWGPVRVRRSTLPSPPQVVLSAREGEAAGDPDPSVKKPLMT